MCLCNYYRFLLKQKISTCMYNNIMWNGNGGMCVYMYVCIGKFNNTWLSIALGQFSDLPKHPFRTCLFLFLDHFFLCWDCHWYAIIAGEHSLCLRRWFLFQFCAVGLWWDAPAIQDALGNCFLYHLIRWRTCLFNLYMCLGGGGGGPSNQNEKKIQAKNWLISESS